MAKTKQQKKVLLDKYQDILAKMPNYIIVDSNKVGARQLTQLKKSLKESKADFMVVKNTLFKIAAQETEQPKEVQELVDANGIIVCGEDPTAAAKALYQIQKENENLKTKYAVLFGEYSDSSKVDELAAIPSREELLAKLVGSLNSPLSGFVSVAQGNIRKLLIALSEIQKNK